MPDYAADIQPLLGRRCLGCHGAGGDGDEAPDLSTRAAVSRRSALVQAKVRSRSMPPPGAPPLEDGERALLLSWLVCQPASL